MTSDVERGEVCVWCRTAFLAEHGHPVLCDECYRESDPDRVQWPRAIYAERRWFDSEVSRDGSE